MENDNSKIFNRIYKYHLWGVGSGSGSVYKLNKPFVGFVNNFLKIHKDVKVVVDIGCGDWQLGNHFRLNGKKYIGCDVSGFIVNKVNKKFSSKKIRFVRLDAVTDNLPKGDLVIVKDVLQHLSNANVMKVLRKVRRYKYRIIVNDIYDGEFINKDVNNGYWRAIDVTKNPFKARHYKLVLKYTEGFYKPLNFIRRFFFLKSIVKGVFVNYEFSTTR